MKQPDPLHVLAWINLNRAGNSVLGAIELTLKSQQLPPLAWYDVLLELERAPNMELQTRDLQERLLLPQYGLSRILKRIETAGFIERSTCEKDRRQQMLKITPSGISTRHKMWEVYGPAIQVAFADKFTRGEISTLAKLLQRLSR